MPSWERLGRMAGLLVLVATLSSAGAGGGLVRSLPGSDIGRPPASEATTPEGPPSAPLTAAQVPQDRQLDGAASPQAGLAARVTTGYPPGAFWPETEAPGVRASETHALEKRDDGGDGDQAGRLESAVATVSPGPRVITHTVAVGETITGIADQYGVSARTITQSSGLLNPDRIHPGQWLRFPSVDGVLHEVRSGDTLSLIAKLYRAGADGIIDANALRDPNALSIGQVLIVPGGVIAASPQTGGGAAAASVSTLGQSVLPGSSAAASGLSWPLHGTLTSYYGPRWGSFHTGIDIGAAYGATIRAAAGGKVTFSDWYGRYGRTVIIDHGGGVSTLYSHAATLLVSRGQVVTQGQAVATVGSSGNSTGPHLHFEVRVNGQARNPLNYLRD